MGRVLKNFLDGDNSALWLSGYAGVGKTVLTSASIEVIENRISIRQKDGLAYFYCDYKNSDTQNARNILRSLIQQAAMQSDDSLSSLLDFMEKLGLSRCHLSLQDLQDLLLSIIDHFDTFFVIIDALDECSDKRRHEVLDVLLRLRKCSTIKLLATSREDPDIAEALESFAKVDVIANDKDIEMFVAAEIERRIRDNRLNIDHTEVKEQIIDKLSHSADGM